MHFELVNWSFSIPSPPVIFEVVKRGSEIFTEWMGMESQIIVVDHKVFLPPPPVFNSFVESRDTWWKHFRVLQLN